MPRHENNFPFVVDYAKSARSKCQLTKTKIAKGTLRLGVMVKSPHFDGYQPNWFKAKELFASARKKTKGKKRRMPTSVDEIGGFEALRPGDQDLIEDWISKCPKVGETVSAPSTIKKEEDEDEDEDGTASPDMADADNDEEGDEDKKLPGTPKGKKVKKEQDDSGSTATAIDHNAAVKINAEEQQNAQNLKSQSSTLWKIQDVITSANLPTSQIRSILDTNKLPSTGGAEKVTRRLVETLWFGIPPVGNKSEGCCDATTPLRFDDYSGRYVCGAPLPWGTCQFSLSPEEVTCGAVTLPSEVRGGEEEEDSVSGEKKDDGNSSAEWIETVMEVCGEGFPPHERFYKKRRSPVKLVPAGGKKRKRREEERSQILTRKNHLSRACVDPVSELSEEYHVLDEAYQVKKGRSRAQVHVDATEVNPVDLYDTSLCQTDLSKGTNSKYKLQILIKDDHVLKKKTNAVSSKNEHGVKAWKGECYLWRVWGRVGGDGGGGTKLQEFGSVKNAKKEFCRLFKDKTGNEWADRKSFEKKAGKFYQLDLSYVCDDDDSNDESGGSDGNPRKKQKISAGDPASKLPLRVQNVISAFFDGTLAAEQLKRLNVDVKKMPLGKMTEGQLRDAHSVLAQIEAVLLKKKQQQTPAHPVSSDAAMKTDDSAVLDDLERSQLEQLSNQFYTKCPSTDPILIDNDAALQTCITLVDELLDLQASASVMKGDGSTTASPSTHRVAPVDVAYQKLKTDMTPLDPAGDEYQMLKTYVSNGRNASLSSGTYNDWAQRGLRLLDAFSVNRHGEAQRYQGDITGNRHLLWHGSRMTNYPGILGQGLRIAPPEAPVSGYRFGKGLYFADLIGKSACYCRSEDRAEMYVMACDVALGEMYETPRDMYMEEAQPGSDSTHALSEIVPDPSMAMTIEDDDDCDDEGDVVMSSSTSSQKGDDSKDYKTIKVPLGTPVPNPNPTHISSRPSCDVSEFIVYNPNQVKIRYLLRLTTDPTTPAADDSIADGDCTAPPQHQSSSVSTAVAASVQSAHSDDDSQNDMDEDDNNDSSSDHSDDDNDKGEDAPKHAFIKMDRENTSQPSLSGLPLLSCRTFVEGLRLTVVRGDITTSQTDAIVVPTDDNLSLTSMVGEKVKFVAGDGLVDEIDEHKGRGVTSLPWNFTRLDAGDDGGRTIRAMALDANVPFLTPYYLVLKKESISKNKDVIAIDNNGTYHLGDNARKLLKLSTTKKKVTLSPSKIPEGTEVFVQSTSHNRKIPNGSSVLLKTSTPDASNTTNPHQSLKTGETHVTGGHDLPSKHIIFVASPVYNQQSSNHDAALALQNAIKNILAACSRNGTDTGITHDITTVAIPSIGSGRAGYDKSDAAHWIITAIGDYLREQQTDNSEENRLKEVCFCLYDDESVEAFKRGISLHERDIAS